MIVTSINKINIDPVLKKLGGDEFGYFSANMWYRRLDDYVPYRTGQLAEKNIKITPWQIEYYAPYSDIIYFNKRGVKFRDDPHSKAGAKWDERAIQEKQDQQLAREMQGWINKHI